MDEIKDIIQRIIKGCGVAGLEVSEILAAFVARTVVESDTSTFALDKKKNPKEVDSIVVQSIEKLLGRDDPALEMIKMQVDYDSTYLHEEEDAQKKLRVRNKMITGHKMAIVEVEMSDPNDFEALTTLYRKMFRFLLEFAPNSKTDKVVEREIAAALESVFPRVGLKTFIQLSYEEKATQLMELSRIILGIRLFNREEGRGGAGLDTMDKDSNLLANVLSQDIAMEVEFFTDACAKYQKAIIKAHNQKRKRLYEQELEEDQHRQEAKERKDNDISEAEYRRNSTPGPFSGAKQDEVKEAVLKVHDPNEVSDFVVERWSKELANRRQYLGFLKTLQEEINLSKGKIQQICDKIQLELVNVRALVSNKNSVPKEVVYPRFDSIGTVWLQLYEEVVSMIARSNTFQTLCKYRLSFNPTLTENFYMDGSIKEISLLDSMGEGAGEMGHGNFYPIGNITGSAEAKGDAPLHTIGDDPEEDIVPDVTYSSGATLLSVMTTPDFMLLPLEFQGYCPWTLVEARGLLLPGKPALGIIRHQNLYYVFDHVIGIKAFIRNPDYYLKDIRNRALQNPEYIHLLRLQRWFPSASIAKLLQYHDLEMQNKGQPLTRDAATDTPTHIIETYIDVNYHWNEWELRRRALKVVNLKGCKTTSQQTDESHFKRDSDTQVYENRTNGTQTKRETGTNPPIVTTYISGLRGKVNPPQASEEKYSPHYQLEVNRRKKEAKDFKEEFSSSKALVHPKVGVVTLKLDL
eukprot:gene26135-34748_t